MKKRTTNPAVILPAAGNRNNSNGSLDNQGSNGNYWSGTVDGTNAYNLNFNSTDVNPANDNNRANGFSVRCIQHSHPRKEDGGDPKLLLDLFRAYFDARKNKRSTVNALAFEERYEENLFALYDDIVHRRYKIARSICFIVEKPVKREIFAADFRDRIVHHLLFNYLNPIFEPRFIADSYSCRKGKGTSAGIRRLQHFIRSCSENHSKPCWILKLDIKGYFMSMDKNILYKKVERAVREARRIDFDPDLALHLARLVIFNDPTKNFVSKSAREDWVGLPKSKSLFFAGSGKGFPVGNLTSQLFSNIYLDEFDHYVREELGVERYGRYVDDMVFVHADKEALKVLVPKLDAYLREHLALTIHPKKVHLQEAAHGAPFLGAFIKPWRTYAGYRTKRNFYASIAAWNAIAQEGWNEDGTAGFLASINSYLGMLRHFDTFQLRRKAARLLHAAIHRAVEFSDGFLSAAARKSETTTLYSLDRERWHAPEVAHVARDKRRAGKERRGGYDTVGELETVHASEIACSLRDDGVERDGRKAGQQAKNPRFLCGRKAGKTQQFRYRNGRNIERTAVAYGYVKKFPYALLAVKVIDKSVGIQRVHRLVDRALPALAKICKRAQIGFERAVLPRPITALQNNRALLRGNDSTMRLPDFLLRRFHTAKYTITAAATLILCASVAFGGPASVFASAPYLSSGTVVSTNLLAGESASSITDFYYDLTALPGNSSVTIQFSKDDTNWYSAAGSLGGTTALSTLDGATISLSTLGWSGSTFYYRVTLNATSDLSATPALSGVRLDYVRAPGYESMLSVDSTSGNVEVGGGGGAGGSALSVVGGAAIGPDYFSHKTTDGLLVEGWTGIGTYSPSSQLTLDDSGNGKFFEALNSTIASGKGGLVLSHYSDSAGGTDVAIGNNYYLNGSGSVTRQDVTNSGWDVELNNRSGFNDFALNYINSSGAASNFLTVTSAGKVGVSTSSPTALLTVQGPDAATTTAFNVVNSAGTTAFAVYDNGNSTYSGSIFQSSDERLKTNVQPLAASSSLSLIEQLNPVSYLRLDQPGTGTNLGFLAQQVGGVFPELVSTTSPTSLTPDGTLTLNYEGLIAPIVSAIQDIASVSDDFEQNLIAWLGNAGNGIGDLFANNLHATNELCVGTTCVTPAQFAAMAAAAGQGSGDSGGGEAAADSSDDASSTPPQVSINGDNPATVQVGTTYQDLGATITGPAQDLNLGIDTFVNGVAMSPVQIDTSAAATDTIDYVVTDGNGLTSTSTRTVVVEAPEDDTSDASSSETDSATSTAS